MDATAMTSVGKYGRNLSLKNVITLLTENQQIFAGGLIGIDWRAHLG